MRGVGQPTTSRLGRLLTAVSGTRILKAYIWKKAGTQKHHHQCTHYLPPSTSLHNPLGTFTPLLKSFTYRHNVQREVERSSSGPWPYGEFSPRHGSTISSQ